MPFAALVSPLLSGRSLSGDEAGALARFLFDEGSDAQIGAALALSARTPTGEEIAAFAKEMRSRATTVATPFDDLVDTCGTGGGAPSFNVSTAAALLAAGAGARVAKHGNRRATGACGSADVLEALGVKLSGTPEELASRLERHGIAFLFAPNHHPATARVGPVRRDLGFRTIFNVLGPLLNPAGARRQVLGVYAPELLRPMAEALAGLGCDRIVVVHGLIGDETGIDEVSPCGATRWAMADCGAVSEGEWTPEAFGIPTLAASDLAPGREIGEAAAIVREAITDADSPRCLAALPTAGVAVWLAGRAGSPKEGAAMARAAAASGAAARKLEELAS